MIVGGERITFTFVSLWLRNTYTLGEALGEYLRALCEQGAPSERLLCTGYQEDHKAVYFPTYDKRRMQGALT